MPSDVINKKYINYYRATIVKTFTTYFYNAYLTDSIILSVSKE